MTTRTQILVRGTVQGVGFRPFIFSLAKQSALKGKVFNNASGVLIDVEGDEQAIVRFADEIKLKPPPLSIIESVELKNLPTPAFYKDFRIVESETNGAKFVPVSADTATCADCLREMFDPKNRRYRYPFINCTNCGPRFTIIESIPYDRSRTTMRDFEMCAGCRAEYENLLDRRFHAEPTCCPNCGPKLFLSEPPAVADGLILKTKVFSEAANAKHQPPATAGGSDIINQARQLLQNGKILAVKGIGGFHLACDATNEEAVNNLRRRKYREDKPFALMANSIETIEKFCFVSEAEKALLVSEKRPIVLLERRLDAKIPDSVAPKVKTLGFMLPYAPLHFLLLETGETPLVMTSGNVSDEPICYEDKDAGERLNKIADYYLLHNRRIHIRTDDSIVRVPKSKPLAIAGDLTQPTRNSNASNIGLQPAAIAEVADKAIVLRRSRGYAPAPVKTSFKFERQILACGAELKNTFCLARDNYAFLSHHIGDLENLETLKSFTTGIEHFKCLFNLEPEIIAYDLHPEYLSTKYALAKDAEKIGVQHHHAHIASCLADNRAEGEVIGVAMDGLGFGTDGKLWGGEFFVADFKDAERIAHLDYIPLAGGAKAIREPWRVAAVYLQKTFGDEFLDLNLPFVQNLNRKEWKTLKSMTAANANCPQTSSMGRLFDAISALLCLRNSVNYEGQAAIELETILDRSETKKYEFEIAESGIIKTEKIIRRAVEDLLEGRSEREVSARFHLAVVDLIARLARQTRDERNLNRVALSGGVFQNMFLLERVCRLLENDGFEVLTHSRVPTNDGGISLGQAAIANAQMRA
jgi:hydrogenase maturation protein HypF